MPTRNVNLTEHFGRFIEAGAATGSFSNAGDVVREGLRLLEQREKEDKARLNSNGFAPQPRKALINSTGAITSSLRHSG